MSQEGTTRTAQITLAGLYLLLFAYIGVYMPWFPPLLERRGFDARLIGVGLALVSASRIVLPPLWGLLADRTRARGRILAICALLAGGSMLLQAADLRPATRLAWLFLHGFFLVPLFPLLDALTLGLLGARGERYGRIRLWGSVGFIVASLGAGSWIRESGVTAVPWLAGLPLIAAGLFVPLLSGSVPRPRPRGHVPPPAVVKKPMPWARLVPLIAAAALGQASHGPYYAFFTLQMEARAVAPEWIGALWAWGVAAEVAIMALSPALFRRVALVPAFRAALVLSIARWALYATTPSMPLLVVGQAMHAASFGLLHISTVQLVARITPPGRQAFGQSVLSACAYGGGIGAGLFLAGLLAPHLSDAGLYSAASALCVVALVPAFLFVSRADAGSATKR